jgi:hypothetical protein
MSNNIDQLIWHNNNLDDGFAINKQDKQWQLI